MNSFSAGESLINRRSVGIMALAVLVVVDIILIALALRPSPTPAPVAIPVAPTATTTPEADASPTATSDTAATPETFDAPPQTRLVAVRGDGSALSLLSGACDGPASAGVQIPATGVAQPIGLPGSVVGRLVIGDNGSLELVAASQDCAGQLLMTEGPQPSGWSPLGSAEGVSFMLPGGTDIALPAGGVPYPCNVVSFDARGSLASVLCEDGSTRSFADSAWQTGGDLTNGLALAYAANSDILVGLAQAVDCAGLTVNRSANGGDSWTRLTCVPGAAADGGPVGIGAQGATVVLVDAVGSAYRSVDGGEQFAPIGG